MFHVNGTGRVRRRPWLAAPLLLSAAFPDPAGAQSEDTGVCDRTEQVRDAIAEAVLGVTDCADITATHLGQVTSLYLFAVNIGALKSGDFGGLTALDSLNLGFNDLRTLPADIFDGLASLEYLNLGHNELVLLPNSVFVGLTSLTTLLLGGNPGHPFGPIPEAGPRWNVRPDMEVSLSGSATDPWGRDVTYAWSQSDTSGATVSLDGANTATATLIAPALEKATLLEFTLTVVAVNPGGVRPVGTTAAGDTAQDVAGVNVRAAEPVTATFVQADYTATEGGAAATVGVRLNRIPERSVSIPLMATHAGGATEADYSIPASVTFAFADRVKYVTVTATDDTVDDNGESLTLGFGTLPPAVTAGSPSTVEVTLADNDRAVTGLAVTSDPGTDATYTLGDTIKVTATFGEAVTVTGQPQLTMRVGSAIQIAFGRADRAASYQSGSATDELVFAYVVAAGDTDPDGVSVADGSLSLNGGTLEYGGGTSAGLEHGALDEQTGHKVDAIAPTFVEAFVDGATLTLRFSKTLDEDSSPAGGVFAVTVGGTTRTVNAVGVDEKLVTLTLASPVVPADTVKVGYNAPTTSPIRDRAGFKAASFANKAVTNHTLPAVSIAAIDPAVYEGEDIDFRLTRTGRFAQSLRVGVRVEDGGDVLDGAAGDRYVTFGVGDTIAVLTVATLDDHAYEAHTTVTGTLFEVADYTISPTASAASVTVSDNDVPEIDILLEAADRVAEGAGDLEVRIIARTVADDEPHGSVTVRLRSTAGTATAGADGDFGEVNQTVRFAVSDFERVDEEGTANYVATLTHDVTIHDDTDEEDDETFTLRLSKLGGIQVDLNLPGEPLVVTIVDDDMVVRPGKVTGLSVTEGDEELVLSWTAVSGATGYKVQWKSGTETFADAATDGRQHVVSGGATTTSTIAGLTNGTQYATRVIATNSAGDGDASDERTGTPRAPVTTPGKVTGLSVTEGDEELVLSWTAVSGATGYKVQWKSGTETFAAAATDGRQHVVSGGATTTSTIAGLTNGTQYATRVIATNSAGDGDASDERTGTPRAPVTTPGKVTGLSVTEGDEELVLSWTAVSGATGYKVQWKSGTETFADAATDGREHVVSGGATTTQTISGLTNGTQYATRVIATNSAGDGDASDERTGTPRAPVTTPGKVTGLSVTEGDEELVLSWTAVSGATGYKVQWKSGTETFADAATDGRQHVVSGGATTTSTIAGLTNGTQYATRVIATNSAGDGDASDERTGTPRAPVTTPGKVTGLSVTEGDEELVLSWTAVSGATGYKVQWKSGTETFADAATDGREHVVSGGATTTQTISGLTNGTQYATRVIATNSAGDGDASDERTGTPRAPVTTPGKVTGLSVTEGDEELVLSWTAVSGATGYKVQWKSGTETFADAATDGREHVVSGGATTTQTISGLTNGTQYATRVIATNSAGDGDASDERTGTPRAPVTTPGKVTGLSVTEGDEELVLSWTAVSGATGYKVQWKSGTETFADAATDGRQHVVSGGATTTSTIAGLTNGTQYATRVIATNSAGDGDASDERTGTPRAPVTTPGKVTGLSVTEGDEELVLSWTAVSGATGYKVQWKSGTETFAAAATDGRQHVVSGGATTTQTISGLTNGTQYATRVIATNSAGDGDASDERTGTPRAPVTTPGKVTGLSVTEGDEELVLSWTAVSGATGYKVQWKSGTETFADAATDGRQHVVSGGATTTSTIAGLTNGTQYATRVIATNSAGDGDASDERTGTPRAPVTTPGKVTGLSVTEGDEELVLSWTAVSGATGYKVQWKSGTETFADAATDGREHVVSGGATTTQTISGLTNGTQYATRVIATNSAGDGDASDERTGTPRAPVTTPGKVTGLSVTEGDEELVLSWTAVSGATGYKVQWKSGTETFADAATDGREHVVSGGATTTQTISGLTNGTQYATRVIATNSAGDGDASDERTGTPRAPVTTPGKVTGLSVTEGDEELVLSWTAVSGATGYKVQWKSGTETFADAATDGREHVVSGGATTTQTISGLTNGTQYATRVIATNSAGDGDASDERTGTPRAPVTTPGKVTGLSVTEGDEELVLSWTAVSGATGYKVQWKSGTETFADAATDGRQHVVSGGATTTSTIAGLTNGTQYATRVIATNSAGDGDASDERTGTPRAPVTTPGKVTGLSVTEGDEELVLSWTAVSGATGYKVQWKSGTETFADAATDGREHVVSGGATTTQTISGLTNGTQYATRVIATNSAGDGDASDERTGTPRAPVTTPGKVTGLSVTEGDEELVLSWTAVSGATGYKVQWKSGTETFADAATDGRQHVVSGGATTTSTIAGLTNGTQYATRVIATNSAGDGDASDERTGTPRAPVTTPGKVTGLSVTEGDEELVLSWTAVSGATGYKVQWKSGTETFADAATDGREHVVSGGATTTQTISGLTNGTQYATRVIATNSAGDGDASDERTGTPRAPVTTPGKVTGLSVTEGDEELVLSWTAVSGATGYKVQWKSGTETFADAATDGREHVVSGGATTTQTISGLTNGTQYATRVIATNSAGDGDASDERTGTPRAPVTTPGKVTGLSVTEGDEELVLSWTAVSGATGYKVQWKSGTETFADAATDGRQHVVSGGATTTSTIAGLTNGTQYATRVIATNSAGDGDASDERTGTPRAPVTTPEIRTTTLAMSLVEGDSSTYQVALESAPTGPVTVTVGGWSGTDVSVAPTSFAFSGSNWNEWRTVTVRAEQDDEHEATHEVTLTHSAGTGTSGPTVRVTVVDEDGPLPKLSLRALKDSVTEGDRSHFEITRTGTLDQSLRAGIMVQDLEEGNWVDELIAVYFHPGHATRSVSYKVKVDTLTTTERTLKAWINAMLDGYEVGDPSSAVVHVIDDTSGDAAPRIGISFKQAPQVTAKEGEQGAPVIVRLSEPTADAVAIPIVARGMGGAGEGDWNVPSDVVIEAGESEGTVLVSAVDDAEEDPGESIELSFGTLPRGMVTEDPGSLVVDIEDNDQFRLGSGEARAWLARFGRAAADDAMLAVRERLAAMQRPVTGSQQVTVGGYDVSAWRQALFSGHGMANTPESSPSRGGHAGAQADGTASGFFSRLFSGASFLRTRNSGRDGSNRWSVWGRGGFSGFAGQDGALSLSGDLTTATLGADYASGRALAGVVLSRITADGHLTGGSGASGSVETSLTATYPWLHYALTDRLSVWGMGGYGTGSMPRSPGDVAAGADVRMWMGSVGAAGQLVTRGSFTLGLSADAMFTRTTTEGATRLGEVRANVGRVRMMLEGSSSLRTGGGILRPSFEVGFRQDGGDAETGMGLAVGGGGGYSLPSLGLTVEARGRGLVAHQDSGYEEWGVSGSLRIAPDASGRGLNLALSPSWGSAAGGEARALWSRRNMAGIASNRGDPGQPVDGRRLALDLGYGLAVSGSIVATPYTGTMSDARRVGLRMKAGSSVEVALERMERDGRGALLLNAGYRPRPHFDFTLEAGRNAAGEIRLGLRGNARW